MKRTRTKWPSSNRNGKHPGGRPPSYDPQAHPEKAYALVSMYGSQDQDLAELFGVRRETIWQWKRAHPEFSNSIKRGWDDFASNKVAKSLALRAIGYSHPDEKVFCNVVDGFPEITRVPTTKHYPPETAAAIFWLCNYSRRWGNDEWQQVQRYEHTGKDGGPIQMQQAQLNVLLTELQQQASAAFDPKALRDQIIALPPTNGEGHADDDG